MIAYPAISPLSADRHALDWVIGLTGLVDRHRPEFLIVFTGMRNKRSMNVQGEVGSYYSFLLGLWRLRLDGERERGWRIVLERIETGEQLGFGSIEELHAYFQQLGEKLNAGGSGEDGYRPGEGKL
jgi:hypothetical protein